MENNTEEKERFFAQYYGQEVAFIPDYDQGETLIKAKVNKVEEIAYLELKSLSSITDEHAIEVYCRNLLGFPKEKAYATYVGYKNNILSIGIECINYPHLKREFWDINYLDVFRADYLRSKGYAIPYLGISVEELISRGWAKIKEQ